jgi:hypothetical protein
MTYCATMVDSNATKLYRSIEEYLLYIKYWKQKRGSTSIVLSLGNIFAWLMNTGVIMNTRPMIVWDNKLITEIEI